MKKQVVVDENAFANDPRFTDPDDDYSVGVTDMDSVKKDQYQEPAFNYDDPKDPEPAKEPVIEPTPKVKKPVKVEDPEPVDADPDDEPDSVNDEPDDFEPETAPAETDSDDESSLITPFFDAFAEELGWGDVEEDEKPKTVQELVEYMRNVVAENSKPEFASDEVAELNDYIKAGGSIQEYVEATSPFNIDDVDIKSTSGQKRVVEEHLRYLGWNQDKIRRAVNRYEDSNTLAEEAEDALESLTEIAKDEKENLLREQQEQQKAEIARQEQFYNTIATTVKDVENIRGVPISKQDKAKLMDYIFKVGPDGTTAYARDYNKNIHQSLIESAFFTMKGDSVMKVAEAKAKTSATARLREQLRTASKGKSTSVNRGGNVSLRDFFS